MGFSSLSRQTQQPRPKTVVIDLDQGYATRHGFPDPDRPRAPLPVRGGGRAVRPQVARDGDPDGVVSAWWFVSAQRRVGCGDRGLVAVLMRLFSWFWSIRSLTYFCNNVHSGTKSESEVEYPELRILCPDWGLPNHRDAGQPEDGLTQVLIDDYKFCLHCMSSMTTALHCWFRRLQETAQDQGRQDLRVSCLVWSPSFGPAVLVRNNEPVKTAQIRSLLPLPLNVHDSSAAQERTLSVRSFVSGKGVWGLPLATRIEAFQKFHGARR